MGGAEEDRVGGLCPVLDRPGRDFGIAGLRQRHDLAEAIGAALGREGELHLVELALELRLALHLPVDRPALLGDLGEVADAVARDQHVPERRTIGWIERISFASYLSARLSSPHFRQWQLNQELASRHAY